MVGFPFSKADLEIGVSLFRAGSVSHHVSEWEQITSDKYILSTIREGLTIEFLETPICKFSPFSTNHSKIEEDVIDLEITKLLQKGVIEYTIRENGDFVSSIFTRPKKDGSHRFILNLKKFNEYVRLRHCKLESIEDALGLVTEGCFFGSVDLKDAYYSIPINRSFQKYLNFFWKGKYYKYVALPNGFSPAVREFTKLMTVPFKHLRESGNLSVKYLDDSY